VAGKVSITDHERRWSLTPESPWPAARHFLVVETILEDAAGNSIGRPFEVDLKRTPASAPSDLVKIPIDLGDRK
jgi:hypothetical protein